MKKTYGALLTIASLIVLLTASVSAQAQPKYKEGEFKYKEGERVEFDTLETSNPDKAVWKKATILQTKIQKFPPDTFYVVQLDPLPNKLPQVYTIPVRLAEGPPNYPAPWQTIGWLRPGGGGGGGAPKIETDKLRVDENGTVLADRELLDCNDLKQGTARNGPPPPTELAKTLIRCLYEKPSEPGMDGATKFDITEFAPGAAHRWDRNNDMGSGANINTMVYPFRLKWTQESFYHTFNQVYTNSEAIFTCYVAVDKWSCGLGQTIKDGEKKMIQVK